jgi:hypothetical protein
MSPLKNPFSLAPFSPIIFEIYYTGVIVTQKCSGITHSVSQPNTFRSISFNIANLAISTTNTNFTLTLGITNPLIRNRTRLRVKYN